MLLGKYLNKYYAKYWYLFLIGIFSLVAVDYIQLYEAIFLGQIVDRLAEYGLDGAAAWITPICLKLLGVAAVMFTGRMLWRFTLFNASQRIEAGLRREMFQKSERLSQSFFHATKVGTIMSWFTTDLETIEEYTGFGTVQIVDAAFLGILVIIRMFLLDPVMTLFALIPMSLIIVWGALVEKHMALRWTDRQEKFDRLYDFTQENFTGISVIKAFVKETSEIHAFAKIARKNRDANITFVRVSVLFDTLIEIIIAVILSLILGGGSYFVYSFLSGTPIVIFSHPVALSPGGLVTFIGYFDTLIWPMIALGQLVGMHGRARASLKRVTDYLDTPEDVKDAPDAAELPPIRGAVEFRGLTFAYPSQPERLILDDISLSIEPGEMIGVVGRVGSGKSTLFTLLSRLYNVPKGTVFLDGHDVMDCTLESVRRAVSFVLQDHFLFSDTVFENIAFSKEGATKEEVKNAARFAAVDDNIAAFPNGYETVTGERGVTLSGGQKQRVAIARAYLKDAPILVLDDSVSAVDVSTEETILENIHTQRKGKTTVVIASRISSVAHADRILVLSDGRIEAFDTPKKLLTVSPTYQRMVELQELEKEVKGGEA